MFRANIYQKDIISNSNHEIIDLVVGFNHSLVEIVTSSILIKTLNDIDHNYEIEYFEKDQFTSTYIGEFENGIPFRLIQPHGFSLEMFKSKHNALGAFSLGSLNPDGFAIHFLLSDIDDIRNVEVTEKGSNEQTQRLVDGALMSWNFGLKPKFIEITKRLIAATNNNPDIIKDLRGGIELIQLLMPE